MARTESQLTRDMETNANELATLAKELEQELAATDVDWHAVDEAYFELREVCESLENDHDEMTWVVQP